MHVNLGQRIVRYVLASLALLSLSACGGGDSPASSAGSGDRSSTQSGYSVAVNVTGLAVGQTVTIANGSTDSVIANANSSYLISQSLATGADVPPRLQ